MNLGTLQITQDEFQLIADLIYRHVGIHLSQQKVKLVEGRLQKLVLRNGFKNFQEYYDWLIHGEGNISDRMSELVDRISTNHTYFWREEAHFEWMYQTALPELEKVNQSTRKLRIWCAASSSGQEPYTLAIILRRYFGERYRNWDAGVLATDVSRDILDKAEAGAYLIDEIEPLPKEYKQYFEKINQEQVKILDVIRKDVVYRRFNLMNPFPFKGKFDMIFCRNVMIYFDNPTKRKLIEKMYDQLNIGGYFITSLSESLDRTTSPFKYIKPGIYKKI